MPFFRTIFGLLSTRGPRADTNKPIDADSLQIADVRRIFKLRRTVFDKTWEMREGTLLDFSLETCL